jgi:hypothetical protein
MGQHRARRRRGRGHRARRGLATPQGRAAEPAARCGQAGQHRGPGATGGAGGARARAAGQATASARQAAASAAVTPAARTRALGSGARHAGGCNRRAAAPAARIAVAAAAPERQRPRGARVRSALGARCGRSCFAGGALSSAFAGLGAPRWLLVIEGEREPPRLLGAPLAIVWNGMAVPIRHKRACDHPSPRRPNHAERHSKRDERNSPQPTTAPGYT